MSNDTPKLHMVWSPKDFDDFAHHVAEAAALTKPLPLDIREGDLPPWVIRGVESENVEREPELAEAKLCPVVDLFTRQRVR